MNSHRESQDWHSTSEAEFNWSTACASQLLPHDWACLQCDGPWNQHAAWEAVIGPQCLSGEITWNNNMSSVSPECGVIVSPRAARTSRRRATN
jgi:hypothetical protein